MKEVLIVVSLMFGSAWLAKSLSYGSAFEAEEQREYAIDQAQRQSPTATGHFLGSIQDAQ